MRAVRLDVAIAVLAISACRAEETVDAVRRRLDPKPDPRVIGVWVVADGRLLELPSYGREGEYTFAFADPASIPAVSDVRAFYINLPDATATESKLYYLRDLKARWHDSPRAGDPQAVPARMEVIEGSLYKISPVQRPETPSPYVAVRVRMPLGTPDRLYAVRIAGAVDHDEEAQRRTMSAMRALATAIEAYAVDNNVYPPAACADFLFTTATTVLSETSFTRLTPTYIAQPPRKDGWGRFLLYGVSADSNDYAIRSRGRDGADGTITCRTTTSFDDDILYSNGTFIQWPEGRQQ